MSRLAGCLSLFFMADSRREIFPSAHLSAKGYTVPCIFPPKSDDQPGRGSEDGMKRLLTGFLLLLGAAGVVGAQEESGPAEGTKTAASFERTSAPKVSLLGASEESSEAPSVAAATAEGEAPANPPAKPRFVFGDRD